MIYTLLVDVFALQGPVGAAMPRDGLGTAADISLIVMAVGSGLALFSVAVVLLQIRKLLKSLHGLVQPVTDRARIAAENVEYISAVVRTDIQKVNESIGAMTSRLNEASDHMEDRVQEFNALMEVVQGEAERVFIDTAAAVRGVQAGARSMSGSPTDPQTPDESDPAAELGTPADDAEDQEREDHERTESALPTTAGFEAES